MITEENKGETVGEKVKDAVIVKTVKKKETRWPGAVPQSISLLYFTLIYFTLLYSYLLYSILLLSTLIYSSITSEIDQKSNHMVVVVWCGLSYR